MLLLASSKVLGKHSIIRGLHSGRNGRIAGSFLLLQDSTLVGFRNSSLPLMLRIAWCGALTGLLHSCVGRLKDWVDNYTWMAGIIIVL